MGGVTGEVNGDLVHERRLGWNDVIGNREEGSRLGMRELPPHTHTPRRHLLSRSPHTSSAGTHHAEIHAPPVARPHLPLLINPDLSDGGGIEEEEATGRKSEL